MNALKLQNLKPTPVILITGCASGIGAELAKQLYSRQDLRVIVTCRKHAIPELQHLYQEKENFEIHSLDVTQEENIYSLINYICGKWGRIDVLINNAGVCYRGVVEHMDSSCEMLQLKTNYLGPMALARSVLPIMREQREGHIINISSVAGIMAMPTMASYSASKHALEGATEALWYEARPFGIRVNLIELGFVNSNSYKNVLMAPKAHLSTLLSGPHSEYYNSMTPFIKKFMLGSFSTPNKIAKAIIQCVDQKRTRLRVFVTIDVYFFNFLKRIMPSHWLNLILFKLLPGSVKWGKSWKQHKK